MFFIMSSIWALAAVGAFLFVGLMLLPGPAAFLLTGTVGIVTGFVLLVFYSHPIAGIASLVAGIAMIVYAFRLRARLDREQIEAAEENANRISRMMSFHMPTEDDMS